MRRATGQGWQGRETSGDSVASSLASQASRARGKPELGGACSFLFLTQPSRQICVFMERTPDTGWLTQVRRELPSSSSSLSRSTVWSGTLPRQAPVVNPRGQPLSQPQAHCASGSRGVCLLLPMGLATRRTPSLGCGPLRTHGQVLNCPESFFNCMGASISHSGHPGWENHSPMSDSPRGTKDPRGGPQGGTKSMEHWTLQSLLRDQAEGSLCLGPPPW